MAYGEWLFIGALSFTALFPLLALITSIRRWAPPPSSANRIRPIGTVILTATVTIGWYFAYAGRKGHTDTLYMKLGATTWGALSTSMIAVGIFVWAWYFYLGAAIGFMRLARELGAPS